VPGEPPAWAAHLPAGVDHAAVDLLAERSLPAAIARRAAAAPDRPALGQAGGGWLPRGELDEATTVVAGRLHQAGLRSGDRVAFSAAASLPLVVAYLAALRLGLVVVPVNPAYSERELGHVIGDAEPRAAVVDDRDRAASVRRAAGSDVLVVGPEVDLPDGASPALDQGGPEEEALICYTSGTTGSPKGAVLSHGNLLAGAEAVRLAWRWDEADRLVLALPLFHVHGLCIGLNGTLLTGASRLARCSTPPPTTTPPCSSACPPCTRGWPTRRARPSLAACDSASPGPRRCPRPCSSALPSCRASACWSATG
jgi:malonyl-CoA/methylmalonyl-CoA synthetase